MSGCGARTAAGSPEAVFESSDVDRGAAAPASRIRIRPWRHRSQRLPRLNLCFRPWSCYTARTLTGHIHALAIAHPENCKAVLDGVWELRSFEQKKKNA